MIFELIIRQVHACHPSGCLIDHPSGSFVDHLSVHNIFPTVPQKALEAGHHLKTANASKVNGSNNNTSAPGTKKNTLATSSKNNEEVDGKPGSGALFVKVSMDGAPYLRKVDVRLQNDIITSA
ncbi:hypothetical protein AgCh_005466 [Apium graveolens]